MNVQLCDDADAPLLRAVVKGVGRHATTNPRVWREMLVRTMPASGALVRVGRTWYQAAVDNGGIKEDLFALETQIGFSPTVGQVD